MLWGKEDGYEIIYGLQAIAMLAIIGLLFETQTFLFVLAWTGLGIFGVVCIVAAQAGYYSVRALYRYLSRKIVVVNR